MYHAALRMFEQAEQGECVVHIDTMVLAECVHALTGPVYRRERSVVARALSEILLLEGVTCEDKDRLTESLMLFAEHDVDFTDAYLACKSRDTDGNVVSFNRDFQRLNVALHVPEYTD